MILITGANGYIGSCLSSKLHPEAVVTQDSMRNYTEEHIPIKIKTDIIFEDRCREMVRGVSAVIHLGAVTGVGECENAKSESERINVYGTTNLLKSASEMGVEKFIFASTSAVYGQSTRYEVDENHRVNPRFEYGKQKYQAEMAVRLYSNRMTCIILRKSNVYGKALFVKNTVFDSFMEKVLKKETIFITGSGNQKRDFLHIEDCISAYQLALQCPFGGTFNIGGSDCISISDLAELINTECFKIRGHRSRIEFVPKDEPEWRNFYYNSERANRFLGYEPKRKIIDEIHSRLRV